MQRCAKWSSDRRGKIIWPKVMKEMTRRRQLLANLTMMKSLSLTFHVPRNKTNALNQPSGTVIWERLIGIVGLMVWEPMAVPLPVFPVLASFATRTAKSDRITLWLMIHPCPKTAWSESQRRASYAQQKEVTRTTSCQLSARLALFSQRADWTLQLMETTFKEPLVIKGK